MIKLQHSVTLRKGQTLIWVPIGDIHHNLEDSNRKLFKELVGKVLPDYIKHGCKLICHGNGDYTDPFSTSEKMMLSGGKWHDGSAELVDKAVIGIMNDLVGDLAKIKNHWVGLHEGHHYHYFMSPRTMDKQGNPLVGSSSTQYLCRKLGGAKYYGQGAALVTYNINGHPWKVFTHHGIGTAATENGRLLKRKRLTERWDADCYALGHDHSLFVRRNSRRGEGRAGEYDQWFVGTGGYLEGYPENVGSHTTYVEKALLPWNDQGSPIFEIRIKNDRLAIDGWEWRG
jgi:hypothetical protein